MRARKSKRYTKGRAIPHTLRASYDWKARWSDEEDNVKRLASDMREMGIRAATSASIYVGHRTLAIHPLDLTLAVEYLHSIGEGYIADAYDRAR